MKIGIVVPFSWSYWGGVVEHAENQARALEALGVHPRRALLGAALGGALLASVGPAIVLAGFADLEPLFPRARDASVWVADAEGGLLEVSRGYRVGKGGALVVVPVVAAVREDDRRDDRSKAVALALALLSLGAPYWATLEAPRGRKAFVLAILVAGLIASFQLVAARRVAPWIVVLPPFALLAHALLSRYRGVPRA